MTIPLPPDGMSTRTKDKTQAKGVWGVLKVISGLLLVVVVLRNAGQKLSTIFGRSETQSVTAVQASPSPSTPSPAASAAPMPPAPAASAIPASPRDEKAVIGALRAIAATMEKQYAKAETSAAYHKDWPLALFFPSDSLSITRTDDLITPYRGYIRATAMLNPSGDVFADHRARMLTYRIVWPYRFSDGKWSGDGPATATPVDEATKAIRGMDQTVLLRIAFWSVPVTQPSTKPMSR